MSLLHKPTERSIFKKYVYVLHKTFDFASGSSPSSSLSSLPSYSHVKNILIRKGNKYGESENYLNITLEFGYPIRISGN